MHGGIDLTVGQSLMPSSGVVGAHVLSEPRVAARPLARHDDLATERAQRPQLCRRCRELTHRVVELDFGAGGVGFLDVRAQRFDGQEGVVDVWVELVAWGRGTEER